MSTNLWDLFARKLWAPKSVETLPNRIVLTETKTFFRVRQFENAGCLPACAFGHLPNEVLFSPQTVFAGVPFQSSQEPACFLRSPHEGFPFGFPSKPTRGSPLTPPKKKKTSKQRTHTAAGANPLREPGSIGPHRQAQAQGPDGGQRLGTVLRDGARLTLDLIRENCIANRGRS